MQPILFTIGGFGFVGLIVLIRAAYSAPEAVEDQSGFHLLQQADRERYAYPSSSVMLAEGDALFFQ
jgi:hypothetical protein